MNIGSVTSLGGDVFLSSLSQTIAGTQSAGGSSASSSLFGPATLMAGSVSNLNTGTYNSVGQFSNPAGSQLTPAQQQRKDTLNAIASKIDGGNPVGGREDAEKLLKKDASDVTVVRLVAVSYMAEEDYENAEKYFERASVLSSGNEQIATELRRARVLQKSDDEVIEATKEMLRSRSSAAEAATILHHVVNRSPHNGAAHLAMADAYGAAGKPMQMMDALKEAVTYVDDQQAGSVVDRTEALVGMFPQLGLAHNIHGKALQKAGKLDEAIESLEAASNMAPMSFIYKDDLANAHTARGLKRLSDGDITMARVDLGTARELSPGNRRTKEAYARVAVASAEDHISAGLYEKALTELTTARLKAPNDDAFKREVAALYVMVGRAYEADGDTRTAISSYSHAYGLDPSLTTIQRKAAELSYAEGMQSLADEDYDEAIRHLQKAYDTYRVNSDYGTNLAEAYNLRGAKRMSQGKLDDAIEDFISGYAIDPTNASLSANYSSAIQQQNAA